MHFVFTNDAFIDKMYKVLYGGICMQKNLTVGSPLKHILKFAFPIFLGCLFQQFYSMVDAIIVGQFVGIDALAGVGATGSLNFLVLGFVIGLASGFCIPISHSFGANQLEDVKKYYIHALFLALIFSLIITSTTLLFLDEILLALKTPLDIFTYSYDYMFMIFAGTIGIFLYNLLASLLRSLGDSKTPLYFLILSSILNIVLDLVFIIQFDMGVLGAGLATSISQTISGILCFILIVKRFKMLQVHRKDMHIQKKYCMPLLANGIPMGLQFSITAVGSILMQVSVNTLGSFYVAAITSASKIIMLTVQGIESLGITMASYCGQNIGAQKLDRVKKGIAIALGLGSIYSVICIAISYFFGEPLVSLFINEYDAELYHSIQQYLIINSLFYFFLSLLIILRNAIQGMGYSKVAMIVGAGEMVARAIVAIFFVSQFGYSAVLYANPSAWIVGVICLVFMYSYVMKDVKQRFSIQ